MVKTGARQRSKALAAQEWSLAIEMFAEAMRTADTGYIARYLGKLKSETPMTLNMQTAMERFIVACGRLEELNGKKA